MTKDLSIVPPAAHLLPWRRTRLIDMAVVGRGC
jgi:hypothetical protein